MPLTSRNEHNKKVPFWQTLLILYLFLNLILPSIAAYSNPNENRIEFQVTKKHAAGEKANRLINEQSPYLLQHAFNPVQWYPWGEEAFQRAKDENKPIFLSIGYSTCHWCHVMAHESFENPEIAIILNKWFISIKVDREERPDIDQMYMAATQEMTGSGGWPMSLFLLPDGSPFFAGTYFPPQPSFQRPGFKDLLTTIHSAWNEKRENIQKIAAGMVATLQKKTAQQSSPIEQDVFTRAYTLLAQSYNSETGGFGSAPRFPRPVLFSFLFTYYQTTATEHARNMALVTLDKMAAGGMNDQIGGGFHRYSVDRNWFVPHFEKMLYDQAQLGSSYVDAYQVTGEQKYATTARRIFNYVLRDMRDTNGGFYSAEDADSDNPYNPGHASEGGFYLWKKSDIETKIGREHAAVFSYRYGIKKNGNVEHDPAAEFKGRNILYHAATIKETAVHFQKTEEQIKQILSDSKQTLLSARQQRTRPHLDDKIITAWNGMMIGSLARAGRVLQDPRLLSAAVGTATFLRKNLYNKDTHTLYRRYRDSRAGLPGQLSDYTSLVHGLLELYQASQDPQWLSWAVDLTSRQFELFWNKKQEFFFDSVTDPSVKIRMRAQYDSAEPAGNSVAALNLIRLGQLQNNSQWQKIARQLIESFSTVINRYPPALPLMLTAWQQSNTKPTQVIIAGKRNAEDTRALFSVVNKQFDPARLVLLMDGAENQDYLTQNLPFLANMVPINNKATAYVCAEFTCKIPVREPAELRKQLNGANAVNRK